MSYNFPYVILRQDLKELEVGFYVKSGDKIGYITAKRPFRKIVDVWVAAGSTLTIQFVDTDSNLSATSGTMTLKGYVGSTSTKPWRIVQIKYIAFTTPTEVSLKWGKDPIPLHADVTFSSKTCPAGLIQQGNIGASPLALNKFSADPSQYLAVEINNSAGSSSVSQGIVLECVEYEWEEAKVKPKVYDEITAEGFLMHVET